jgi:hypothetical protein
MLQSKRYVYIVGSDDMDGSMLTIDHQTTFPGMMSLSALWPANDNVRTGGPATTENERLVKAMGSGYKIYKSPTKSRI